MTRNLSVLTRVSSLAIAAALTASAAAQSFLGEHTVTFGSANVTHGTDTTDIEMLSTTAVIDWTPDDPTPGATINFQEGGTATFFSGSDFAVLNRINVADASRQVLLNGTIQSIVGESTGGSVFFYSPSGFVIGSSAIINVGSLVLSASPIFVDPDGNFLNGTSVTFNQAPNSSAEISTSVGSQINAFGSGAYVALVAPQITHQGTIRTDRAAALVAAEAATINFSPDGLFDIQVTVGADAGERLIVDGGTITRNPNTPEGTNHYAYLVAVAKNDAVTMLIENGGSIGFETASSAQNGENNMVILSGGDVTDGSPIVGNFDNRVDLAIDSSSFSSHVLGDVSGSVDIRTSTGDTDFGRNLALFASEDSIITAINGNTLSIGGDLNVNLDETGIGADTTASLFRLSANGFSTLTIGGSANLSSQVFGFGESESGVDAADVTGGTVIVQTGTGSTIDIAGNLNIDVDAQGGVHGGSDAAAGSATGGTAQILANGGSSAITVDGTVTVSANAEGGAFEECSVCSIAGGNGTGGNILLQTAIGSDNQLNLNSSVSLSATGSGGAGDAVGGSATGGIIQLVSADAGAITIGSSLTANAWASGGTGIDELDTGTVGGDATGGFISMSFAGAASTINLNGDTNLFAYAFGGDGGGSGGDGDGGRILLQLGSNGTLNSTTLFASADGFGGSGDVGGDGSGGQSWVQALEGATLNIGDLSLSAFGSGGTGFVGGGGTGTGGNVLASAVSATLNVTGDLSMDASGQGGHTSGDIEPGGNGQGGHAEVFAAGNGTVNLDGFVDVGARGFGGSSSLETAQSGDGTGGEVIFQAFGGGTLDADSDVFLNADGFGGFAGGDCNDCGGAGGNGFGGTVTVQVGSANSLVDVAGQLNLSAEGFGASGFAGPGGNGTGGIAQILLQDGGDIVLGGDVVVDAIGWGGDQTGGGQAGSGTGGTAEIFLSPNASVLTATGVVSLNASGLGGAAVGAGGTGGSGLGGLARIVAGGGTANLLSDVSVNSNAAGGNAVEGTGGSAQSGMARVIADGGVIDIGGNLTLNSISTGGDGINGGDAIAFIGTDPQFTATSDARVVAGNGSITVGGFTSLNVSATGGSGASGGGGGDAVAGFAVVHALNRDAGAGTVTLGDLSINAEAFGGAGGDGLSGTNGTDGGTGGSAEGGLVVVTASAGNGHLAVGDVSASVSAFGGNGGAGGGADGGTPGNGGAGGQALGGMVQVGTESGLAEALGANEGTATYSSITMLANASGGDGGTGGFGGGTGGDGGDAGGGTAVLLVRGSEVNVGFVGMTADATGGDGGAGSVQGAGGDAESDEVVVLVTNRADNIGQRGTLNAAAIVGSATSTGGAGSTPGAGLMEGGSSFIVENSDATIGSVDFNIVADGLIPDVATDSIAIVNGQVTITGAFNFNTSGVASVYAADDTPDTPALTANTLSVSASNFIHDPERAFPGSVGTISADTFNLVTGQDLIIDAHLVSTSSLNLSAPGLIDIEDASSGADLTLDAGGSISGGSMTAAGLVDAVAGGDIGLNLVIAGSDITIQSTGGSIFANGLSSGGLTDLHAATNVTVGDITSGDSINILADTGGIGTGDVLAQTSVYLDAAASINVAGMIDAGNNVTALAGSDILTGDIFAFGAVDLDATGSITTGDITAATIDLLAGVDISTGDLTTQIIQQQGGGIGAQLFPGASITLQAGGDISTGDISSIDGVYASAGGGISTGAIGALDFVQLLAGADIITGAIDAGGFIDIFTTGGDIMTGDLFGTEIDLESETGDITFANVDADHLDFDAGGAVTGGNIVASSAATGEAQGAIVLGNITVGPGLPPAGDFSVGLASATSITVGDVSGTDRIGFATFGDLVTGDLAAGNVIMTLVGGDITVGSMATTAPDGQIFMADAQMFVDAGGLEDNFDPAQVFASDIIPTGGSITINGQVDTGLLTVAAGGLLSLNGDVTTDGASLMSGDIALASGVTVTGSASLVSINPDGTFIGDGLSGPGYMLSNAEYNSFEEISFEVRPDLGAAASLILGDLNINSSVSEAWFAIEDADDNDLGTIRVVGDVRMNNGAGLLGFESETFQLDAATGSIVISSDGTTPGGELFIQANNIHVAEGSILDQLAADPQYDGYQDDLNAPASVQRPEGVVRAGTVTIEFGDTPADFYSLYVQNMGTEETPAGFVITDLNVGGAGETALPPGSVDLIINGQLISAGSILTGVDVRDLLVVDRDLTPFTDNSTINGCLLVGACGLVEPPEPPFPPGFTPTPGIQQEIVLIKKGLLGPPEFDNEDFIDDNDETTEEGATSPIEPPQPLFDTSGLGGKGDVDDPVSGSGNPALMENPQPPSNEEKQP